MEQIAVQAAVSAQPSIRNLLGMAAGQTVQGGDAFAMIFQQLMGEGDAFGALLSQMSEDVQEDADELGRQMMAEMLFAAPDMQTLFSLAQGVQPEDMLDISAVRQYTSADSLSPLVGMKAEEQEDNSQQNEGLKADGFYSVLQGAWKQQEQPSFAMGIQGNALREAKALLEKKPKETVQMPDIENLQEAVNAKRFFPAGDLFQKQATELPDISEIAAQVKSGVLDNVAQGKNEFVIRLKPEGMGEIVVKLSENKEKISLSIFTASTQAARMITNEVVTLQNALRPLRAEVEQITVAPEGHAAAYASQNAMSDHGQQFAGQQSGLWQQEGGSQHPENGDFEAMVQQSLPEDGLDTYI